MTPCSPCGARTDTALDDVLGQQVCEACASMLRKQRLVDAEYAGHDPHNCPVAEWEGFCLWCRDYWADLRADDAQQRLDMSLDK